MLQTGPLLALSISLLSFTKSAPAFFHFISPAFCFFHFGPRKFMLLAIYPLCDSPAALDASHAAFRLALVR